MYLVTHNVTFSESPKAISKARFRSLSENMDEATTIRSLNYDGVLLMSKVMLSSYEGAIATITLNRPEPP